MAEKSKARTNRWVIWPVLSAMLALSAATIIYGIVLPGKGSLSATVVLLALGSLWYFYSSSSTLMVADRFLIYASPLGRKKSFELSKIKLLVSVSGFHVNGLLVPYEISVLDAGTGKRMAVIASRVFRAADVQAILALARAGGATVVNSPGE